VLTRPEGRGADWKAALTEAGAAVSELPLIAISFEPDDAVLTEVLDGISQYDWIVFTSANAVRIVLDELGERGLGAVRVACVGSATADALARRGVPVDLVPQRFVGEGLADALLERLGDAVRGQRFLLPRAAQGREEVRVLLRAMGAEVHDVPAYRTVPCEGSAPALRAAVAGGGLGLLTFTSPSTVKAFDGLLDEAGRERARGIGCVCLGPITADAARALGYRVLAVPETFTAEEMANTIASLALGSDGKE